MLPGFATINCVMPFCWVMSNLVNQIYLLISGWFLHLRELLQPEPGGVQRHCLDLGQGERDSTTRPMLIGNLVERGCVATR